MPYTNIKDANVKVIDGAKLTLEQANKIAAIADAITRGDSKVKNAWAAAITTFKKSHIIKNGKWNHGGIEVSS